MDMNFVAAAWVADAATWLHHHSNEYTTSDAKIEGVRLMANSRDFNIEPTQGSLAANLQMAIDIVCNEYKLGVVHIGTFLSYEPDACNLIGEACHGDQVITISPGVDRILRVGHATQTLIKPTAIPVPAQPSRSAGCAEMPDLNTLGNYTDLGDEPKPSEFEVCGERLRTSIQSQHADDLRLLADILPRIHQTNLAIEDARGLMTDLKEQRKQLLRKLTPSAREMLSNGRLLAHAGVLFRVVDGHIRGEELVSLEEELFDVTTEERSHV